MTVFKPNPVVLEWEAAKEALDKANREWRKARAALMEASRPYQRAVEMARRDKADARERFEKAKAKAAAKAQAAAWDDNVI